LNYAGRVTVDDDHSSDRRFAMAVGGLMAAEVALAALADAGVFALWVWCALAVAAIFVAALVARVSQASTARPPRS
jgi:hypothetical protein